MNLRALSVAITVPLALWGCETSGIAPPITPALVAASGGKKPALLAHGRELFTGRCTTCHSADPPSKYTGEKWREIVRDMAGRAKLSEEDQAAILAYLAAARGAAPSGGNGHSILETPL